MKATIAHTFGPNSDAKSGDVAALIYFDESVTLEQADAILTELANKHNNVRAIVSGTYYPPYGAPVWYVP